MTSTLLNPALLAATVTTGLTAGFLAAFAHTVMPALAGSDDAAFVGTFQILDKAVYNPWFGVRPQSAGLSERRSRSRPAHPQSRRWLVTGGRRSDLLAAMTYGEWYQDGAELAFLRSQCEAALELFNGAPSGSDALLSLLGRVGEGVEIVPRFRCSYGFNVTLGDSVFINADAFLMDDAPIRIASNVRLGPSVKLMTALHPIDDHARRRDGWERALGIDIGENAWLAAGVIIGPGVSVGRNTVVGAGSVVLSDLPDHVVAAGSPAVVIRETPVEP